MTEVDTLDAYIRCKRLVQETATICNDLVTGIVTQLETLGRFDPRPLLLRRRECTVELGIALDTLDEAGKLLLAERQQQRVKEKKRPAESPSHVPKHKKKKKEVVVVMDIPPNLSLIQYELEEWYHADRRTLVQLVQSEQESSLLLDITGD